MPASRPKNQPERESERTSGHRQISADEARAAPMPEPHDPDEARAEPLPEPYDPDDPLPSLVSDRYELRGRLGTGGMGTVYRAYDKVRQSVVALKTMPGARHEVVYWLKREFRSLADVIHPNLVGLHDLVVADDHTFFTMDEVDGLPFVEAVRVDTAAGFLPTVAHLDAADGQSTETVVAQTPVAGGFREQALRRTFPQVISGVRAIHEAGKVHCDVKPSNVLVTPGERVVILDFGMTTDVEDCESGYLSGTPAYMAPEQAKGHAATPASDWYSVGVLLFEALTGRLPFRGAVADILAAKISQDPPRPSDVVDGIPADLDELCHALLARDPGARPDGEEIATRLGERRVERAPNSLRAAARTEQFVNRVAELAALHRALASIRVGRGPGVVLVRASSGMGKTALMERFLREVDPKDLVLRGGCHQRESVAFKALDRVVDSLASHLESLHPGSAALLMPRDIGALSLVFPVLGRWGAGHLGPLPADPIERRRRATTALKKLLENLAARTPIVLWVDDLQWGDADSAQLLAEVLNPPTPTRLLFIGTHRDEESPFVRKLLSSATESEHLTLGPLSATDAVALTRALDGASDRSGRPLSDEEVEAIHEEAGGSPFFIHELVVNHLRSIAPGSHGEASHRHDLDAHLAARASGLPPEHREVLELISLAAQPVSSRVIAHATRRDDVLSAIRQLVSRSWLKSSTSASEVDGARYLPYHDRIREAVSRTLSPMRQREAHDAIATALIALDEEPGEALVEHLACAERFSEASRVAIEAAQAASRQLAFERAARLYERAIEHHREATAEPVLANLLEEHAEALVYCGRSLEAGKAFERAADALDGQDGPVREIRRLRRLAGSHHLFAGNIDHGHSIMRNLLSEIRVPMPKRPFASGLAQRARLLLQRPPYRTVPPSSIDTALAEQVDALWFTAEGTVLTRHVLGDALALSAANLALRLGDPARLLRAVGHEAASRANIGGEMMRRSAASLLDEADRLAALAGDPESRVYALSCRTANACFCGQWHKAIESGTQALDILQTSCRDFLSQSNVTCSMLALAYGFTGNIPELRELAHRQVTEGDRRGNLFASTTFRMGYTYLVAAADDEPDEGIRVANEALEAWSASDFTSQHLVHFIATASLRLYAGRDAEAFAQVEAAWPKLERAGFVRLELFGIALRALKAHICLAVARRDPHLRKRCAAIAQKEARRIARSRLVLAAAHAAVIRAACSELASDMEAARRGAAEAADAFETAEMPLHAAACRFAKGRLSSDDASAELDRFRTAGAKSPERLAALLVPVGRH